jgi:hypothetical protein
VIASTVPSPCTANTSATPFGLGTAGIIASTQPPLPGFDHTTVPAGTSPATTVTSAAAPPAVTIACPAASAVSTGGSPPDKLTTLASLVVHSSPFTACPAEFNAWSVRVSPTARVTRLGVSVTPSPPAPGAANFTPLLHIPFC